jgi:protein MpaA
MPVVNPDGYAVRRRRNANRVDLNRNLPTSDWAPTPRRSRFYGGPAPASEPETQALIRLIETVRPVEIVSIHSISDHRYCNNFDGPGGRLARAMAGCNGYPVRGSIGYATPGSFGSWAGGELQIPTVTLELPSHHSPRRCWEDNRAALLVGLDVRTL